MKHNIAKVILNIEKDKLMSEPESNRDWELITALDIAIKGLEFINENHPETFKNYLNGEQIME